MTLIILFMLVFNSVHAQPRPVGTELAAVTPQNLVIMESELLSLLSEHTRTCYPSLAKEKSFLTLMAKYALLTSDSPTVTCTKEELDCLHRVPIIIKEKGRLLLQGEHYRNYLVKNHKLEGKDADRMISNLSSWLGLSQKPEQVPNQFGIGP